MKKKFSFFPDILIVGAGIAGSIIAAGLRGRGYSVIHIEASEGSLDTARGDHLGPRVVETLEKWNILQSFFDAGAEKRLGAKWFTYDGEMILHSRMDDLPLPHPYYIVLNHDLIASVALDLAKEDPNYNYNLFRPVSAKDIKTGADAFGGVSEVNIMDVEENCVSIMPKMTIGCDGRSSRIRNACQFNISKSYDYEKPFVVLFGPRGELEDPRNEIASYISPKGGISRIPRMNGQWKVGLAISKEEIGLWKASNQSDRKRLIAERSPALDGLETEVAGFYPVIRRETESWVKGTTVLIGDSCHTIHPARGQGMNFGIRCASRLFEFLPDPDDMKNSELVSRRLKDYELEIKPQTDIQLDDNHNYALTSDSVGLARMEEEVPMLRHIAEDPKAHFRYRMTMAGYPHLVND